MRVERTLVVLVVVVLAITAVVAGLKLGGGADEPPAPVAIPETGDISLMVIGVQGLEASIMERVASAGGMPNLSALVARGATATYETLGRGVDSSIVWTSLVTGMLPENQGIGGMKLSRRGEMVRAPLLSHSRTVGTLWTMLEDAGAPCGILGWPGTWPVEEVSGVIVGPYSTYVLERSHGGNPAEAIFPVSSHSKYDPLVLESTEFSRRDLSRFVNMESEMGLESLIGQNYVVLAEARAGDRSMVDLAKALAGEGEVRSLFVNLAGTDLVSQRFWHYMDTEAIEMLDIDETEKRVLMGQVEALGETILRYYEYLDEMIGELVALTGDGATVVVMTDHGYEGVPLDDAGMPLVGTHMHSEQGLLIAAGPRVAVGANGEGWKLIDVAPSIMALVGIEIPPGLDGEAHREIVAR